MNEQDIVDAQLWCMVRNMEGYRPSVGDNPETKADKPIAEAERCPRCGAACTYVAYKRLPRVPGSYRAAAICWPCNRGWEF
jgi:hypothetical protein